MEMCTNVDVHKCRYAHGDVEMCTNVDVHKYSTNVDVHKWRCAQM